MLNIQPLNLGYKLVADFLLLLLQILWQIVLIFVALIPCGSRLHPSLPCKTYPWRISPSYRHKCRCPCLSSRTTSCPTSIFYGTMRPRACHRPSTTTRGRCNRQTTTTTRPTRGLSSPAEPHLCPAALAARLEQHLRQLDPQTSQVETPPPPYEGLGLASQQLGLANQPQLPEEGMRNGCREFLNTERNERFLSNHRPSRPGGSSPRARPVPPPRRRRAPSSSSMPTAPPPLTSATDSD